MDAKQLFFERYDGFREYPGWLRAGMDDRQLRQAPAPAVNPVAWILWHMARCEDVAVNRLLGDRDQVLDSGAWSAHLATFGRQFGTGMTRQEAWELGAAVDLELLDAYRAAVTARTVEVVGRLPDAELERELSFATLRAVLVDEGAGGRVGAEIVTAYAGHTKGWLLGHLVLTHNYYHMGQAFVVRALHGLPNPG